ncbi:meiotic recombination protein SPO11-1 [Aristolochia californica]|uniref:meiotic recombination protein SPO11-1 n=1 Tax=Aristolochia californica TaxID=171875 RepID=UPI0035DB8CA6
MEGRALISNSDDLLQKIKGFTRSLLEDICHNGQLPSVVLDRFRSYCSRPTGNCECGFDLRNGTEVLSLERKGCRSRLDVMLRVLLVIQKLLQENKHISKRDIYYMHPSVFSSQGIVDQAINDLCVLLKCSRHKLNVVSVAKGLVMGWLRFHEAGRKYDCMKRLNTGYPIPVRVEEVKDIVSFARYILVVEKETVFQRLANDGFCDRNHCIVLTGRGYPDVATRRFLRLLVENLMLPAYCLVDCDPHGFDILATYRFGSMQMAYDTELLRVDELRWLGVFPSDCTKYNLPDRCLLALTPEDQKKTESMLLRCYLHREARQWRAELEYMLQRGLKFEIEALSVSSISFLSDVYIPSKIHDEAYI